MSERLIDVVPVSDHPGHVRWQAVAPCGFVAGVVGLRPTTPFGPAGDLELSLYVEPDWRRRGIGSRLLAAITDDIDARLIARLIADVEAGSPGEAFCRRHGFRHTGSRRHDLLTYCDLHLAWLGELVDAEPSGYRLTHWVGDLPDARGVEDLLRSPSHPGNAVLTAADADGDLAAYAVAVVDPVSHPRARQYGPAVHPDHRGGRLGVWVNAALAQRLREVHPHVDEIETTTAEDDLGLLDVREHLGFRPLLRTHVYERQGRTR